MNAIQTEWAFQGQQNSEFRTNLKQKKDTASPADAIPGEPGFAVSFRSCAPRILIRGARAYDILERATRVRRFVRERGVFRTNTVFAVTRVGTVTGKR